MLALTVIAAPANAQTSEKTEVVDVTVAKSPAESTKVIETVIAPGIRYEFSRSVGAGRLVQASSGVPGYIRKTYRVTSKDGKLSKQLVQTETKAAQPAMFHMGRSGYVPSRGAFVRGKVMTMESTGYDPSPATIGPGATGLTKTGMRARYGVVAVDPRVIRLGTLLFVEGYGFAIAADIGGAIKGNRIDLCFETRSRALVHGRRPVKVHILRPA